jgi:hypothetical protein
VTGGGGVASLTAGVAGFGLAAAVSGAGLLHAENVSAAAAMAAPEKIAGMLEILEKEGEVMERKPPIYGPGL